MTHEQFAALAKLIRLRNGPAQDAARLALVEGMSQTDAARQSGCSLTSCNNTVTRVRAALELSRVAVGAM